MAVHQKSMEEVHSLLVHTDLQVGLKFNNKHIYSNDVHPYPSRINELLKYSDPGTGDILQPKDYHNEKLLVSTQVYMT